VAERCVLEQKLLLTVCGRFPDGYFPGWFFPGKTFPGRKLACDDNWRDGKWRIVTISNILRLSDNKRYFFSKNNIILSKFLMSVVR